MQQETIPETGPYKRKSLQRKVTRGERKSLQRKVTRGEVSDTVQFLSRAQPL